MEGVTRDRDYRSCQGYHLSTEHRALAAAGPRPATEGDSDMSRHKDLALRLAVVAAFVLTLAAPFRW
jgi:hypothetical protein